MATKQLAKGSRYHHGDLRHALIESGLLLARQSGPEALGLREVTRRVGVSANAAYRHFDDHAALLDAVCSRAQAEAALVIEAELAKVPASGEALVTAQARLRAVGTGYVRFAQREPGLFRTAFSFPSDLQRAHDAASAGSSGLTPFQLLGSALDGLVAAGGLAAEQRVGAEFVAWSAVHGLAMLAVNGPLRGTSRARVARLTTRVLDLVERGLAAPPAR